MRAAAQPFLGGHSTQLLGQVWELTAQHADASKDRTVSSVSFSLSQRLLVEAVVQLRTRSGSLNLGDDAVCALAPPGSVKVVITLALGDLLVPVRAGSLAEHKQTFERRHPEGCLKCLEISPALPDHLCMVPVTNYNHC